MDKPAPTSESIHALLKRRFSPLAFSSEPVTADVLRRIFEAARWAPSSFNEQPWRFVLARREDEESFERLLDCVIDKNREWAAAAPVLALSVARTTFAGSGQPNRHALHDVGLAVCQLTTQATALGVAVHQIAGFDVEAARAAFAVPEPFEPVAVLAIGYPGDPDALPAKLREKERAARRRMPLTDLVFAASWDRPWTGEGDAESSDPAPESAPGGGSASH